MKNFILFIIVVFAYTSVSVAQNYPKKPSNYVSDDANILTSSEQNKINEKLKKFEKESSVQIFIYISNSLNGYNLESTTQAIFDAWKVGQNGKDNGVLITVFKEDRKFRIQTGYGIEALLPDIACSNIQDEYIIPNFKDQNYFDGLNEATDQIISYLKGEITVETIIENKLKPSIGSVIFFLVLLAINLLILFYVFTKENKLRILLLALMLIACTSLYLSLYFFALKVSYSTLISTYIVYSFNFLFSICSIYLIDKYIKSKVGKITNYIFQFLFLFLVLIMHGYFCYVENLYRITGMENDSDFGIYTLLISILNFIYMLVLFMTVTPGGGSSSGSSYSSRSSSSWSSSSSSRSSSSSGSSFSGGGGGRSGGGGSSGSW